MSNIWKKILQIGLKDVFLSFMHPSIDNIVFALNPAEGIAWQVNIINQIRIDTFLDCFQIIFGRVDSSRPIFAIFSDVLRFILALVTLFIYFVAPELIIKMIYMVYDMPDPVFRLS